MSTLVHNIREVAVLQRPARLSGKGPFLGGTAALASAAIWGGAEGAISKLSLNPITLSCMICLTSGVLIIGLMPSARRNFRRTIRIAGWRRIATLGTFDTLNGVCMYAALGLAPVGPAVAIHMGYPVILMIWDMATGRRHINPRGLLPLVLIGAGLLVMGLSGNDHKEYDQLWFGLLLALVGAIAVACFLTVAKGVPQEIPVMHRTGVFGLVTGVLSVPLVLIFGDISSGKLEMTLLVAIVVTPAAILNWAGITWLKDSVKIGALNLTQPFFGSLYIFVVYHRTPAPVHYLVMILVAAGIYLCLTQSESYSRPPGV